MKKIQYIKLADTGALMVQEVFVSDTELTAVLAEIKAAAYEGQYAVENIPDEPVSPLHLADIDAMLVDYEYRIALLEIGVI